METEETTAEYVHIDLDMCADLTRAGRGPRFTARYRDLEQLMKEEDDADAAYAMEALLDDIYVAQNNLAYAAETLWTIAAMRLANGQGLTLVVVDRTYLDDWKRIHNVTDEQMASNETANQIWQEAHDQISADLTEMTQQ